jgi:hypothetical protein
MGIDGVESEPVKVMPTAPPTAPPQPTATLTDENVNANDEEAAPENVPKPSPTSTSVAVDLATAAAAAPEPTKPAVAQGNPMDGEEGDGECNLLGDFALLVQGALWLGSATSGKRPHVYAILWKVRRGSNHNCDDAIRRNEREGRQAESVLVLLAQPCYRRKSHFTYFYMRHC